MFVEAHTAGGVRECVLLHTPSFYFLASLRDGFSWFPVTLLQLRDVTLFFLVALHLKPCRPCGCGSHGGCLQAIGSVHIGEGQAAPSGR